MNRWLWMFLGLTMPLMAVDIETVRQVMKTPHPFHYDLGTQVIAGKSPDAPVMVAFHGYGGDRSIAQVLDQSQVTRDHLVSFNFPDYQILRRPFDPTRITFGTIEELLPALYVLKRVVLDAKSDQVSLYGFSAGAGAIVNVISVLNNSRHDDDLRRVGIETEDQKREILSALNKGIVLLDAPLKSMQEILDQRQGDGEIALLAKRYRDNDLNPIDSLQGWQGLALHVIVFFQDPDTAVTNRDDDLFSQRLKKVNALGKNVVLKANQGGHTGFHRALWDTYKNTREK